MLKVLTFIFFFSTFLDGRSFGWYTDAFRTPAECIQSHVTSKNPDDRSFHHYITSKHVLLMEGGKLSSSSCSLVNRAYFVLLYLHDAILSYIVFKCVTYFINPFSTMDAIWHTLPLIFIGPGTGMMHHRCIIHIPGPININNRSIYYITINVKCHELYIQFYIGLITRPW